MDIKILGSVSPRCYKNKNCIGYLIQNENNNIMLDCGNGSLRLMSDDEINNLKYVIISHLHYDHFGELLSLGYQSYISHNLGLLKERIKVLIPKADFVDEDKWGSSRTIKKEIMAYQFLMNFGEEHYLEFITYDDNTKLNIENIDVSFAKNPHQISAYSAKVTKDDKTLVYSADTGYVGNSLEKFAKNANILICESTYLKGQYRKSDTHLYANEAALIAKNANVEKLVLTHFYPTLDKQLYLNEAKDFFENTIVAEEGKVLKLRR